MLINMNEMLKVAKENKFGVPAFNIGSKVMLDLVIEECEKNNAPVILEIHPDELEYMGDDFAKYIVNQAKITKIPVVVHLDHGSNLQDVVRAITNGFTSVMIDASHQPFAENIKITKEVVNVCHKNNISVEGELGTIGNNDGSAEGVSKDVIYTNPVDVIEFTNKTDVDTLAVAIGTAHGIYPKDFIPKLRLDILTEISEITDKFLVLHGGSNNKDEEIAKAVKLGIQKVNISSDYKRVLYDNVREYLNANELAMEPHLIYKEAKIEAQKVLKHKLELLDTIDKAKLY